MSDASVSVGCLDFVSEMRRFVRLPSTMKTKVTEALKITAKDRARTDLHVFN